MNGMKLPDHIRGAIFDLDGTLLDSLNAWADVDRRFFAKRGIPLPPDYYDGIKTLDLHGAAVYTKRRFGLPDSHEELMREWQDMIKEEYALRIGMKAGAAEYVRSLHSRGIALGVATSSSPELFLPTLERFGLDGLFSAYALTSKVRGKEFPDVYLLAAEKLGVPPQCCAVFEDILPGIRSAKSAGFFTVAVLDAGSEADFPALRAEADEAIETF